jgi:hypothetical protein
MVGPNLMRVGHGQRAFVGSTCVVLAVAAIRDPLLGAASNGADVVGTISIGESYSCGTTCEAALFADMDAASSIPSLTIWPFM